MKRATIVLFEGTDEVIVGLKKDAKHIKNLWFDEGGRSIEDYAVYICSMTDGFSISLNPKIGTADLLEEYEV